MRLKIQQNERRSFLDPDAENDRLFHDEYSHPDHVRDNDCLRCCDQNQSKSRSDRERESIRDKDNPQIHYDTIESSNQLQISMTMRNRLQKDEEIICFEMKRAEVIDKHSALMIREICDYSNSHKNKKWQRYAAVTAAAYAKELLSILPVHEVVLEVHDSELREEERKRKRHKKKIKMILKENLKEEKKG